MFGLSLKREKRCMSVKQEQEGILLNDFYIYCSNVIVQ